MGQSGSNKTRLTDQEASGRQVASGGRGRLLEAAGLSFGSYCLVSCGFLRRDCRKAEKQKKRKNNTKKKNNKKRSDTKVMVINDEQILLGLLISENS